MSVNETTDTHEVSLDDMSPQEKSEEPSKMEAESTTGTSVTFSNQPSSKIVPPRQRASMLPKPEIGPKPNFVRGSPVKRQLPIASGPPSLNLMSTSLPSPFASSPSPNDSSCDNSRSIWGHNGSFSEAVNIRTSPGSNSSHSSCNGSPVKNGSPPSPNSKIPSPTHPTILVSPAQINPMSQSLIQDATSGSRHCSTATVEIGNSPVSRAGNLSRLTAKASGTASMLRSTLKRMTRLAISTPDKQQSPPQAQQQHMQLPALPSPSRVQSQIEMPSPVPGTRKSFGVGVKPVVQTNTAFGSSIQRSRSFRDAVGYGSSDTLGRSSQYGPSSISSIQNYSRSNSLRRSHRNKDLPVQPNGLAGPGTSQTMRPSVGLQRSGTNGTLERNGVRRSNSTAGSNFRRSRDHNVRKSRGVQTLLTKDTYLDEDTASEVNQSIEFSVYLPDLLDSGGVDRDVETVIVEPTEPIDVRRNRQLTLDNMKLNRELEKLRSQLAEVEPIKRELKLAKQKLDDEQKTRIKIEQQLDQHNEKVIMIAQSMDKVEREFEVKDQQIRDLEAKLAKAEAELVTANDVIKSQKSDIAKAVALQRTLLMQYQESEIESKELHEFLQAEKYTLAETLKDCEAEMSALKAEIDRKTSQVEAVEERCGVLVRLGEQRHQEIRMLEAQLKGLEERAKAKILAQGSELSAADAVLSELLTRLKSECPKLSDVIVDLPVINGVTDSLDLVSPDSDKTEDEDPITGCLSDPTLQNLSAAIMKRQKSEELNFGLTTELVSSPETTLNAKIDVVKTCVEKLIVDMKNNRNSLILANGNNRPEQKSEPTENGINGHFNINDNSCFDPEPFDLNGTALDESSNEKKEEMIAKFLRHRKILISNYEQAEQEIRRVDEIYHDTVNHVLEVLGSLPLDTQTQPELLNLKNYLAEGGGTESLKRISRISTTSKSDLIQVEPVPAGKRQILHLTDTAASTLNQSL